MDAGDLTRGGNRVHQEKQNDVKSVRVGERAAALRDFHPAYVSSGS
jgi:hypothetical protein